MADSIGLHRRSFRVGMQWVALALYLALLSSVAPAQTAHETPAANYLNPIQLGELVAPIALYPDDLLALVLAAATEPLQIIDAWRYLETVRAVPTHPPDEAWDDAVVALLNYPEVVERMNRDLEWTIRLGEAVAVQQEDVIAAVAEFRAQAQAAGNLTSNAQQIVSGSGSTIQIQPANPAVIYVPYYEPAQVLMYRSTSAVSFYPRPYPAYHYPYAGGYPGSFANFWGVGSSFSIGWSSRNLRVRDHGHVGRYAPAPRRPGHFHRGYRDRHHDGRDAGERRWQPASRRRGAERPATTWSRSAAHSSVDSDHRARWSRSADDERRSDWRRRSGTDDDRSRHAARSESRRRDGPREVVNAAPRVRQLLPEPIRGNRGLSPPQPRASVPTRAAPTHHNAPGAYTRSAPGREAASRPNWTRPQAAVSTAAAAPQARREASRRDAASSPRSARSSRGASSNSRDAGGRSRSQRR